MSVALITGITGQDGSYLAQLLLEKGYRVIGAVRDPSAINLQRLTAIQSDIEFEPLDLADEAAVAALIRQLQPTHLYNLAARASSSQLADDPLKTLEVNAVAVVRLLEAIRRASPATRLCQASSSEIFGAATQSPQRESTPFAPRNPYGIAKLCAHGFVGSYRELHGLFACSAILYNHESPRRGAEFVTRKISSGVARIKHGRQQQLQLGDLDARRDWGFAGDYMQGLWQMLEASAAADYVLATGELHTVREFCDIAFRHVGLNYEDHVVVDPAVKRPAERVALCGDAAKARSLLGWQPRVSFAQLVCMMVDEDMRSLQDPRADV